MRELIIRRWNAFSKHAFIEMNMIDSFRTLSKFPIKLPHWVYVSYSFERWINAIWAKCHMLSTDDGRNVGKKAPQRPKFMSYNSSAADNSVYVHFTRNWDNVVTQSHGFLGHLALLSFVEIEKNIISRQRRSAMRQHRRHRGNYAFWRASATQRDACLRQKNCSSNELFIACRWTWTNDLPHNKHTPLGSSDFTAN